MTRDDMLSRISSAELSAWFALYLVEADEAEMERHRREAGPDRQVFINGRDDDIDNDGETE